MLRIAICDDSPLELEGIHLLLSEYQKIRPDLDIAPRFFSSPRDLLEHREGRTGFQIYLLDIIMPDMDGIELGRLLREGNRQSVIIYLTSSRDYALESFGVFALQYLLKPLQETALFNALDAAVNQVDHTMANRFAVKTQQGIVTLLFHCISYVEYNNHILHFYLDDGSSLTSSHIRISFEEAVAPLIKDRRFLHPHKSYLVNMNYIRKITSHGLMMADGTMVPVPRKNSSSVKKEYMQYLSEDINLDAGHRHKWDNSKEQQQTQGLL